jgi:hypothetical protein
MAIAVPRLAMYNVLLLQTKDADSLQARLLQARVIRWGHGFEEIVT